ncbi:biopolymer transporter ExbD [Flavobacterium salilacus subsp. salilacus]|uniref:ExbD/TolR family protein n=1 Tax=Flavobacterium TaxID=237 RepID=UPI001074BBA5|nr:MULTISPECIES: biopolymer transporter ExbD [Flavobacterium]KAF2516919.1 biopolymer transporter ExbD [Flavobacterium salilacus subsp. salilacus]MBE1615721.1 biopolymer transporter ExbD [Flavobacterium sp. SaA2.13]NDI99886.1 biopolymer transporter ExbD [Flavobacterium salilacus subsp. altitudinum]
MQFRSRNRVTPEFNMSSMTDIVFLLLIFFMITSTMVTTSALDLNLPKAKGRTENNQNVSVNITKDLEYYIDTKPVAKENLEATLKSMLEGTEGKAIVLRAEQGVPIENAVAVMDIAYRNQYKIVLAVDPK